MLVICLLLRLYRPLWPKLCTPLPLWLIFYVFAKYQWLQAFHRTRHWATNELQGLEGWAEALPWSLEFEMTQGKVCNDSGVFSKAQGKVKRILLEPDVIPFKPVSVMADMQAPWGWVCHKQRLPLTRNLVVVADLTYSLQHVSCYRSHISRGKIERANNEPTAIAVSYLDFGY